MAWSRGTLGAVVVLVVVLAAAVGGSASGGPRALVLAARGAEHAAAPSAVAASSKGDRWVRYLADERTCPGGGRSDLSAAAARRVIVCLINWARRQHGVGPLELSARLSHTSALKALDITRCRRFAHDPCGGRWDARVRESGYAGRVGENLFLASGPWSAPRVAVDGWLNSRVHRENLFDPRWRRQGFAVAAVGSIDGIDDSILWVSEFGDR